MGAKSKLIGFRVSPEEYELLRIMAKRERLVISELLREIIRKAAKSQNIFPAGLVSLENILTPFERQALSESVRGQADGG